MKKLNNLFSPLKEMFSSETEKPETPFVPFPEAEKAVNQPEQQQSAFKLCFLEIQALLDSGNLDKNEITQKLEELNSLHEKRVNGFKEIIKRQTEFHRNKKSEQAEKSKRKSEIILEQQKEIKMLKECIDIYKNLEIRYTETVKKLDALNSKDKK